MMGGDKPEKEEIEDVEPVEAEVIPPADGEDGATADAAQSTFLADMEAMQKELDQAKTKAEEYLDGWQRARAEFTNYRKRVEREQAQARENVVASVVKRYLEILDDLDRALKNRPQEDEGAAWAEGIELIYRKLQSMLDAEGVKQMDVIGQQFDPNKHEAIAQEPSDEYESGQIIDVVKQGYQIGDRVIRPALVRIAR